jgi:hypothetical protein
MPSPAKRLLTIIAAIGLVAACESPAAPIPTKSHVSQPTDGPRFDVPIDSSMCRNGYNVGQGRCNP